MYQFIFSHLAAFKTLGLIAISAIAGETVSAWEATTKHPAIISALVGGSVALFIKLIDVWYENRKTERTARKNQTVTADKVLEIETVEKRELREEMRRVRNEEKQLAAERLAISQAETFEARQRAHRFGNEVMKLQSLIIGLQNSMHANNIPIPEITFTPYHDLMFGSKAEQDALEQRRTELAERMKRELDITRSMG